MNLDRLNGDMSRIFGSDIAPLTEAEAQQIFSGIPQRKSTEDRRHSVRQLVMAARLAEARLRELGQEAMADTLRVAIKCAVSADADLTGADLARADLAYAKIRDGITITKAPICIYGLCY